MESVKLHLLATIVATQAVALYIGRVPYFPIEISRTAASSFVTSLILGVGFAVLPLTLHFTKSLNLITLTIWLGLLFVAIPDSVNLALHLVGVVIVFAATGIHVWIYFDSSRWPAFVFAVVIFSMRIVMKACVLLVYDPVMQMLLRRASYSWSYRELLHIMLDRNVKIMNIGRAAFGDKPSDQLAWHTISSTLKICGVLQWVAFYALSTTV